MKSAKFNSKTIEGLWMMLKHLSAELRLELASRLINSLKPESSPPEGSDDWMKLFGSWSDEPKSAEELINEIRTSRISNRKIETFD